ncbi:hypothetical protein T440DRAFT_483856 [Plenodomus tracheiphilus IPT5]|uniref:Uncharacterized protein n=1 Tax=Plenodomus tracheiphilus IPT5 TaxID=1408161 RepID=A0A6A7ARP2_9PLEO|nr:hypothetical protein T440DRAFT_483856 [Plenodomus tracheiphilus IPT5]
MDQRNPQPSRYLDLPAELRCKVYEEIEVTICINNKGHWPVPLKAQANDSRVNLIGPDTLTILKTCHLVNEDSRPIVQGELEYQPTRYFVDQIGGSVDVEKKRLRASFKTLSLFFLTFPLSHLQLDGHRYGQNKQHDVGHHVQYSGSHVKR